jgi:hypothetical protein
MHGTYQSCLHQCNFTHTHTHTHVSSYPNPPLQTGTNETQQNLQPRRETMNVSRRVCAPSRPSNGREPDKHRRLLSCGVQKGRRGDVTPVGVTREGPVCSSASSMDRPFGNLEWISASVRYSVCPQTQAVTASQPAQCLGNK